ncbi:ABC transporter type 1, transmembrane domain-containing protein [Phascolomyces articulosus]|uniref:ABC transporter type 1, transmembrane domain-containing protein n=1 Tax=Phascolomyces articulosus TaxID=60185 RepID=A0AAD5KHD9_9FUNG|nr:ABC transporter type 1, transmembrane domain-containing protein [Phascolomyces articulosus]
MEIVPEDQEISSWIRNCSQNWEPYGCLEDVHLMLVPTIFLLLLAPFRLYILVFKRDPLAPDVARSRLYFVKLVTLLLLLFTMVANLILTQTQQHHGVLQTINIVTMLLAIIMHHIEYTRNSTGSGVLLFYWLLTTLVNGYRVWAGGATSVQHMGLFTITYILSCLMFVLENCKCPIKEQAIQLGNSTENQNSCPEAESNIFGKLIFSWMNARMQQLSSLNSFWWNIADDQASVAFQNRWAIEKQSQNPSLFRALILNYPIMRQLFIGWILKLFYDILQFIQPLLLGVLMDWVMGHTALTQQIPEPLYKGASIAFYMFVVSVVQSLLLNQFLYRSSSSYSRLRSVLINATCRKSLSVVDVPSVNKIHQFIKVDIQTLVDLFKNLHQGWSIPLQITIGLSLLYHMIGFAGWVGVGVMFLNIPIQLLLARLYHFYQKIYNINQKSRLYIMQDILRGIRMIKLYAWELPFMKKALSMQNNELKALRQLGAIAIMRHSFLSGHYMSLIASFTTFLTVSYINQQQALSNRFMFVTIAIYELIYKPISDIVTYTQVLFQSRCALKRLQSFLFSSDVIKPTTTTAALSHFIQHYEQHQQHDGADPDNIPVIVASQAAFASSASSQLILRSIDLIIKKGELVGIIGSQRTSFIHALLGQLVKIHGELDIHGSIAYVSRDPWIFNSNLQDNIVFGQPWDPLFYRSVLDLCEISEERNVHEQKSRVSLARAIYRRADIYILDDPFNSQHMNPQLARRLFHRVIQGHLQKKTRIMMTHTFSCLHQLERIIMLWDGELVMDGTFGDLMSKQRSRLYHIMAINQDRNSRSSLKGTSSTQSSVDDHTDFNDNSAVDDDNHSMETHYDNHHDHDEDDLHETSNRSNREARCWSTFAKTCSVIAVTMIILLQATSQITKVGAFMWLNYGRSSTIESSKSYSFLTIFAIIGVCSISLHTIQCIFLWIVCVVCSSKSLYTQLIRNIMRAPSSYFDNARMSQNILRRLGIDMNTVTQELPKLFHRYLTIVASVTTAIIVIAFSTPFFILFLIPLGFCFIYLRRHYLTASLGYHHLITASETRIESATIELVDGATTIRTCNQNQRFITDCEVKVANYQRACFLAASCDRWIAVRVEFLGSLALLGAALFAVLDVVYGATPVIDAGLVGLSLYYAMSVPRSLEQTIRIYRNIELKMASLDRIKKPLPHEQNEHEDNISVSSSWPEYGRIAFQNYTSATTEPSPFNDATFTISPGERISIIGGNIGPDLLREINNGNNNMSGYIDIDGIDIHTLRLSDLRPRITMIPSVPILFEQATLRENLDPFGEYDDLALWEILDLIQLDVQGGLDSLFFEQKFSNEQCWLFSFARGLLRQSRILIIEEPDELNVEMDEMVQQILQHQLKECTRLIITRKLDSVIESDRVLVLDQGRISAFDTPHSILKYKGSLLHTLGTPSLDGFTTPK